jgi:hypothetical protein
VREISPPPGFDPRTFQPVAIPTPGFEPRFLIAHLPASSLQPLPYPDFDVSSGFQEFLFLEFPYHSVRSSVNVVVGNPDGVFLSVVKLRFTKPHTYAVFVFEKLLAREDIKKNIWRVIRTLGTEQDRFTLRVAYVTTQRWQ